MEKPEEDDWTEAEKQVYQQYLQKVKEQQEERDKLRKILNAESAKINEQIQESCQTFEQSLSQLHRRRLLAETAVLQVTIAFLHQPNDHHLHSFSGRIKNQSYRIHSRQRSIDRTIGNYL